MACRDALSFEEYIREWMYSTHTEASEEIYKLARDLEREGHPSLANAVALAIESLPTRKTTRLRRLVELFEPWCEWKEDWEQKGWRLQKWDESHVAVVVPDDIEEDWWLKVEETKGDKAKERDLFPDEELIAAATSRDSASCQKPHIGPQAIAAVYYVGKIL